MQSFSKFNNHQFSEAILRQEFCEQIDNICFKSELGSMDNYDLSRKIGKRIVVVGTSCSGKTTLARSIASILKISHFELDVLHWGPDWTIRDDFISNVKEAIVYSSWVIDGNYRKVRDVIWERADTIIWLNYTFPLVFWRALKRTISRVFLKQTIFAGNRETFRIAFFSSDSILWWVIKTYKKRKKEYSQLFQNFNNSQINIIQLNNQNETDRFLHDLKTS